MLLEELQQLSTITQGKQREYLALGVYTFDEVMDVILKSEVYGGIYQAKFLQTKYNKK